MTVDTALDQSEDIDIILPVPTYSEWELHNEIRAIHGGMLQLRVWLDRALRADQATRLSSDARVGGIDMRLDKMQLRIDGLEQKLDRVLELLAER